MNYLPQLSYYQEYARRHMARAFRVDADVLFNDVAKQACRNGLYENYTGASGVNFMHPTSHVRGYYNVLKLIADTPKGLTRHAIYTHYRTRNSGTIRRLQDGKLIENKNHVFVATQLGHMYLMLASNYLRPRKEVKIRKFYDYVLKHEVIIHNKTVMAKDGKLMTVPVMC